MSKDKIEGFLIGLGAGVLLAGVMGFRDEPARRAADRQKDTEEALAAARERIPSGTIAVAARA